jgi:hypothetical protein
MSRRDLDALIHFQSAEPEPRFQPDPVHLHEVVTMLGEMQTISYLDADFVECLQFSIATGLYRLDRLPREHPFWDNTNRRPTFGKLRDFAEALLRYNPADQNAAWILAAVEVLYGSNTFGLPGWRSIHAMGALDVRWPLNAALHLWRTSGQDHLLTYGQDTLTPLIASLLTDCGLQLPARNALERRRYGKVDESVWATRLIRFCPAHADPCWLRWNDGTVPKIANTIADEKSFADLPILADALQEAGCDKELLLSHCRANVEHQRGCWVLDFILGKE